MSLAAAAFAYAIRDTRVPEMIKLRYSMCLIEVIKEFNRNGHRYPLNGIDEEIIAQCMSDVDVLIGRTEDHPAFKEAKLIRNEGSVD